MKTETKLKNLLSLLPHKLQVRFALYCAEDVFQYVRDEDRAVIRSCLDTVKLWLEDKATATQLNAAGNAASIAAYATFNTAASNAAYAASITINTAANAISNTAASNAAYAASNAAHAAHTVNAAHTANAAHTVPEVYAAYAANAANAACNDSNKGLDYYLSHLKTMIKDLTELERIIYDLDEE